MNARERTRGPVRWQCDVTLKFEGPLHVGTGDRLSIATDAPLLRDASGQVWLPGSSIRGVIRDWCEREAPVLGFGRGAIDSLFGCSGGNTDRQGRLTVHDAMVDGVPRASLVRDHVVLDKETGAAKTGGKFDQEVVYPETVTVVIVYEGREVSGDAEDPELTVLKNAIAAMKEGLLTFGADAGSGVGWAIATSDRWSYEDRSKPDQLADYLRRRLNPSATARQVSPPSLEAARGAAQEWSTDVPPLSWLRLRLRMDFDGPMMTAASTAAFHSGNDRNQVTEAEAAFVVDPMGRVVLPGSSIRGALRSHAARIAETLGRGDLVTAAFGTLGNQGSIRISEGRLGDDNVRNDTRREVVILNHVAIDRITGFAVDGRLFSAAALASPKFHFDLLALWDQNCEAHRQALALLLMTFRDAGHGLLWMGSRTSRGYGHLKRLSLLGGRFSVVRNRQRQSPAGVVAKDATWGQVASSIPDVKLSWQSVVKGIQTSTVAGGVR